MFLYRIAFWLPGTVAAFCLVLAWKSEMFRKPLIPWSVFAIGLLLQSRNVMFSPAWVVGLVCQVALAVYLLVRFRLDS